MMFGLLGLTAIAVTMPLSAFEFSAIGLGPTGAQTVPFKLMARRSRRLRRPGDWLRRQDRSPRLRSRPAIGATARAHERKPPRWAARCRAIVRRESSGKQESLGPVDPSVRVRVRAHGRDRGRHRPAFP